MSGEKEVSAVETIPGSGNWKLTIRREAAGITILRAATCDARRIAVSVTVDPFAALPS